MNCLLVYLQAFGRVSAHHNAVDSEQHCKILKGNGSTSRIRVQELCESRGGRPGLSVLTNLLVSVDVKNY